MSSLSIYRDLHVLHHHADCKVQYYWLRRRAIICGKSFDCIKRREGGKLETVFLKKINKTTFMRVWRPLGFSPGVNGDWPPRCGVRIGGAPYALAVRRCE